MKFYDRETELAQLEEARTQSLRQSVFTVMVGRRRIGKTALLLRSVADTPHLYLFVAKESEAVLCARFQRQAVEALGLPVYGQIATLRDLFDLLMAWGCEHPYTLIIDEFQNLGSVNPAVFGHLQEVWDRRHAESHVHLVACGSIYSMMHRIFDSEGEPLYGRQDRRIHLQPFRIAVLKQVLTDHAPQAWSPADLLCLYLLTGGVAKYVAQLMDAGACTQERMLAFATASDSPFLSEGRELVVSEFGRDYNTYFSILQLVASGVTTQSAIDGIVGKTTGAYLSNLSREYSFLRRRRPMFSKPGARNVRWELNDNFLRFWFHFIASNQTLVEIGRHDMLLQMVRRDYSVFAGQTLERYFRQRIMEEEAVTEVGNWWDSKGENEIDIIAVDRLGRRVRFAEVKMNAHRYAPEALRAKSEALLPLLRRYRVEYVGYSPDDM